MVLKDCFPNGSSVTSGVAQAGTAPLQLATLIHDDGDSPSISLIQLFPHLISQPRDAPYTSSHNSVRQSRLQIQ